MRAKIIILFLLVCLGLLFGLWDVMKPLPSGPFAIVTDRSVSLDHNTVPDVVLQGLNGERYRLHDFKGRVVVLNIWATWCAPCIKEFPQLLELAAMYPDRVTLIALSVDVRAANIRRFIEHKLPDDAQDLLHSNQVIIAHDPKKAIAQDVFQTVLYPESFIIAPDLRIVRKIAGVTDWTGQDIRQLIDDVTR